MRDNDAALRAAKIDAAEREAIESIPRWLLERLEQARQEFKNEGGCPHCGSMILAVHRWNCGAPDDGY